MSTSASKLRLGPLPKTETVKLTITMSIELKTTLDRYADLHAQAWSEPVDVPTLIPHMLVVFMERDRGFKALRSKPGSPVTSPQPAASSSTAQM
jgi:hypothetical protein